VVHVDEEGEIERSGVQARVVRLAADECDGAAEPFGVDPPGQAVHIVGDDVLGKDMSLRPDPPRQPHRVIAAAGADIGHVEAGFYAQQLHDPLGLACLVARLLVSPCVGDDPGNLPARRRKRAGGDAGRREPVLVTCRTGCG
jgi:hypothetical protein